MNWIDVLVEMLLNLLTINKNFIRAIVKNEFKKLFPILTFDSVKLIVDVIFLDLKSFKIYCVLNFLFLKLLDIENESLVEEDNENDESDIEFGSECENGDKSK